MQRFLLIIGLLFYFTAAFTQDPATGPGGFSATCTDAGIASWTNPATTTHTIVVFAKEGAAITTGTNTTDVDDYDADQSFGAGSPFEHDADAFCVYKGTGNSVNITDLTAGTTYHFIVYNVNNTTYSTAYTFNSATLATPPDVTGLTNTPEDSELDLSWTNPSCSDNVLIVARAGGAVTGAPTATTYAFDQDFSSAPTATTDGFPSTSEKIIYFGSTSPQTITGLTNGTNYHFKVFVLKGDVWSAGVSTNGTPLDTSPPTVVTLTPSDDNNEVSISTTQLVIEFNEAIEKIAGAATNNDHRIILYRSPSTAVATLDRTSSSITVSGNTATITFNPPYQLLTNTDYHVIVGNQVFRDIDGSNAVFPGITSTTAWNFRTSGVSVTSPSLSACSGVYQTLPDILIDENGNGDFNNNGGTRTLTFGFNQTGFVFEPNSTVDVTTEGIGSPVGTNVTITSAVTTFTTLTINYTVSGTNRKERIRIHGLRISPDGTQPTTNIIRTGGNANIDGGNGTGGSSLTYATITSGTLPGTPNGSNLTLNVCQNDVIAAGPNITSNNSNVRWYSDAALTIQITSLDNETNINTPAELTNLGYVTNSPGTITRYVTQTSGGCQSLARTVTLTVQPKPTVDLVITSGSNVMCTNYENGVAVPQAIQFTASPSGGTNYHFLKNGVTTLQNGSSRVLDATSSDFITGDQVTVVVTVPGSCPSTSNSITVTKNTAVATADFVITNPPVGTPNTTTAFSNQQGPVELTGTPSGGTFSGSGIFGSFFHPSSVPIGIYPITYTYTDVNGCTGVITKDFNVYDGSTAFTGLNTSYCADDPTFQITPNSRPGYLFLYILPQNYYFGPYLASGSVVSGNGIDVTAPNEPLWFMGFAATSGPMTINPLLITDNGTVQKTVTFYGAYQRTSDGVVEWRSQNVTFYPRPSSPPVSLQSGYCLGSGNVLENIVTVFGTNLKWYNDALLTDERVALAGNDAPSLQDLGLSATAGTYYRYVTQNTGSCQSLPTQVTINIFSQPSAPVAPSPSDYCARDVMANLTAAGTALSWYSALPAEPANRIGVVNPASVAPLELGINNSTPGTYTRYVTQTISGCQSPHTAVTVVINPIPVEPGSSFTRSYCLNSTIPANQFVVSGSNVRWYRDPALTDQITGISNPNNPDAEDDLDLSTSTPSVTRFYVTQTALSCQSSPITVTVEINDLPSVSFSASDDLLSVCQTDERIKITAFPAGGNWSGTASGALLNTNIPAGTTELNPAALAAGQSYQLTYNFISTCSNQSSQTVTLFSTVNPSLVIGTACNGFVVDINNTSSISPPSGATIDQYSWSFGDGDGLDLGSGAISDGTHGGNTSGTYDHPSHLFRNGSDLVSTNYTLTYTMKTSDNCTVSGQQTVTVNPVPNADFNWTNVCENSPISFTASTNPNLDASIATYDWNFSLRNDLEIDEITDGATKTPKVTYSSSGKDTVRLVVTTIQNCRDTVNKTVYVVPNAALITSGASGSYREDFNGDPDATGWIAGGTNPSWRLGEVLGKTINRDSSALGSGFAWKTSNEDSLYNPLERSWVLSKCFTFDTSKPVISLDVWADTPGGIDGAVLQYMINEGVGGNMEDNSQWKVVGAVNSGINWYQQQGIASKPGNQAQFDYGWSGSKEDGRYTGWKHAVHKLDELYGRSVVFRIAFSSTDTGTKEGFAFDNIFIGERNRNVLIESFTNSSAAANSRTHNESYNEFPIGSISSSEIIKLQYHTSFPGTDPLNQLRPEVHNSRTAFYGITTAPTLRIDGKFRTGSPFAWAETEYNNRVLDPSPLIIDFENVEEEAGVIKIKLSINNTSDSPVLLAGSNLFVAVVEKTVDESAWLGGNGDTEFINVVKEMLPNASGTPLTEELDAGESVEVNVVWQNRNLFAESSGNSALIAFIQNLNAGNQQVLQAQIYNSPPEPEIITSSEENAYTKRINLYPNPANTEVHIELPAAVNKPTPVAVIDTYGRTVYQVTFGLGEKSKTIPTTSLADGMYLVQITTPQGGTTIRKVMVKHY